MGRVVFSKAAYLGAKRDFAGGSDEGVTRMAEQQVRETGKLNPLVDPSGFGVIRRSLPRLEKKGKYWELTVGTPMPIETRVDTTGSMGGNVDVAFRVLPKAFELFGSVLPGYDVQVATGIFGDVCDRVVLCRPQFEMEAEKIVEQLTLMAPQRAGGDTPEDPHYGLFGAAYLTCRHINALGLMGYDFTVSDAPARDRLDERQLRRIYGAEVFEKVQEWAGGVIPFTAKDLPDTKQVVKDLLLFAHAFFLQVGDDSETTKFWTKVFGPNRVVILPSTEVLPHVQATIIGLTEGTLELEGVKKFLTKNNVSEADATKILRSVANIPIGAQAALQNFSKRPQKGDLFLEKTSAWPIDSSEAPPEPDKDEEGDEESEWL